MTTTTVMHLEPMIMQKFNPKLLFSLLELSQDFVKNKIIPLMDKKIGNRYPDKRIKFDKLLIEYMELYVRKKAEKDVFDKEIKDKIQKRPYISTTAVSKKFTRLQTR